MEHAHHIFRTYAAAGETSDCLTLNCWLQVLTDCCHCSLSSLEAPY